MTTDPDKGVGRSPESDLERAVHTDFSRGDAMALLAQLLAAFDGRSRCSETSALRANARPFDGR